MSKQARTNTTPKTHEVDRRNTLEGVQERYAIQFTADELLLLTTSDGLLTEHQR